MPCVWQRRNSCRCSAWPDMPLSSLGAVRQLHSSPSPSNASSFDTAWQEPACHNSQGISVNTHSSTQRLTWSCAWELRMLWLPRPSAVFPVHVFYSCWPENYAYGQNLKVCGVCSGDVPMRNPNFGTGDNESFLPYSHFIYVANLFIWFYW